MIGCRRAWRSGWRLRRSCSPWRRSCSRRSCAGRRGASGARATTCRSTATSCARWRRIWRAASSPRPRPRRSGSRSRAAAAAADAETATAAAPRAFSRAAAAALALGLAAAAALVYAGLGAPGRPDQPLATRLAAISAARAERPSQAEVEAIAAAAAPPRPEAGAASPEDAALVEQLRAAVEARPDDIEGQRLLARSEASLGRWSAARAAQARVVELLGPAIATQERLDLAGFMILAAGGYVSPEAETELGRVLETEPGNPVARYYSGLALLQGGRPDLAYRLWSRLLAEGPADAPWIAPIAAQIDAAARAAGQPAPGAAATPGPPAVPSLSEADRAAMIAGMVSRLGDRLAEKGGPPEDWARLIRSLGVLGRTEEAGAIWREAKTVFAADPAALALLDGAAREAGLAE